jgi:diguanylate cyclase (GGDEF)-like protein
LIVYHKDHHMTSGLNIDISDLTLSSGVMAGAAQKLLNDLDSSSLKDSQCDLLREVLRFATTAETAIVERQMHIQRLEAGSVTDDITGLENERGLRNAFKRAIAIGDRYGTNHVLVLLAIDGLQDVASQYGAATEQSLLQQLANQLRLSTRGSDVLARTSRNEFAALLTPCPSEHATSKAATMAAQLGAVSLVCGDQPLTIDVTAGCASFVAGTTFERISAMAHQMLARRWEPRFRPRQPQKFGFGRRRLVALEINND